MTQKEKPEFDQVMPGEALPEMWCGTPQLNNLQLGRKEEKENSQQKSEE